MDARRLYNANSTLHLIKRAEAVLGDKSKAERLYEVLNNHLKTSMHEDALRRYELEQKASQYMADVDQYRNEMINSGNLLWQACRSQVEKAFRDMRLSKLKASDGIQNARSEAILEFYLERLKQKELFEDIDLRIHQIKSKADQEASNCREKISQARSDIFLHSMGTLIASAAGVLGFMRIFLN